MVRAFGYCNDTVDTGAPSRLCRGRERWIEGLPDAPAVTVHRTVCSGALFSDDSARDASRGLSFSGVSGAAVLSALFPKDRLLAFCENGDPLALPPAMLLEEDFSRQYYGGLRTMPAVRWIAPTRPEDVDLWIAGEKDGLAVPKADGFLVGARADLASIAAGVYGLVGFADPDDRPARKYCAAALPPLLELCRAVVLLHLDKHAPVLAIYTAAPLESDVILDGVARASGAFPVPFAIPPMLARWDRALFELRMEWDAERDGEFPVPPAEDAGGRWSSRRRQFEEEEAVRGVELVEEEEEIDDDEPVDGPFDDEDDEDGDEDEEGDEDGPYEEEGDDDGDEDDGPYEEGDDLFDEEDGDEEDGEYEDEPGDDE